MWFLILLVIVGVCALAYKNRVPLLAKMLGQSETRINRQLKRKPRGYETATGPRRLSLSKPSTTEKRQSWSSLDRILSKFDEARSALAWTTAANRSRCGARNFSDSRDETTIAARNGHTRAPVWPNSPA